MRLLPWRPRWDGPAWDLADTPDVGVDFFDNDFGVGLAILAALLLLPFVLSLLFLAAQLALLLALVPLLMAGQLLGLLPWALVLRAADGEKQFVEVRGTRSMLAKRRELRALRLG